MTASIAADLLSKRQQAWSTSSVDASIDMLLESCELAVHAGELVLATDLLFSDKWNLSPRLVANGDQRQALALSRKILSRIDQQPSFDNEAHTLALNRSAWFASKSGFTEIALSNYQGIIDTKCTTDLAYWNAVLDQSELLVEMGLYKRAGNLLSLPNIAVPSALASVPHVYTGRVAMVLAGLGSADKAASLFTDTQETLIANRLDDAFLVLMYRLHAELCSWQGNYDQALDILDDAESLLRSASDAALLDYKGHICRLRAEIATSTGDYRLARKLLDHARRIAIDMSYDWLAAEVDIGYGALELEEGNLDAACRFAMSALAIARPSGFVLQQLDALLVLASAPGQSPDDMTTYLALTHNLQDQSGFVWRGDRLARLPTRLGMQERE